MGVSDWSLVFSRSQLVLASVWLLIGRRNVLLPPPLAKQSFHREMLTGCSCGDVTFSYFSHELCSGRYKLAVVSTTSPPCSCASNQSLVQSASVSRFLIFCSSGGRSCQTWLKLWHQCSYKASDCFKHRFSISVKEHWEGMTLIWSSHSHGLQKTANQKTASLKEGWLQAYPVKVESGVCVWATARQEVHKTVLIWLIFSSLVIYSRHRFVWALLHSQSSRSRACCGLEALIILKVLTTSIKSLCRTNPPSLLSPLPVLLLLFKSERTVR